MQQIIVVLFSTFFLVFQATGQGAGKGTSPKWLTLKTEEYTIQYPADWEIDQSGNMGTKFYLFSPVISDEDQLRENVNLLTQDLTDYKMTLDEFIALTEGQVETMLTNGQLLLSERIKNKKGEYHKLMYSGDIDALSLTFEQYCWVIGDTAFILTFTGETETFGQYQPTGERILNSFKMR